MNKKDFKLKLGNLLLAVILATVPTAITYGVLGLHGLNICSTLENKIEPQYRSEINNHCIDSSWRTTRSYIILIGFFITLPTWFWFYLSMKRKSKARLN